VIHAGLKRCVLGRAWIGLQMFNISDFLNAHSAEMGARNNRRSQTLSSHIHNHVVKYFLMKKSTYMT
jgi:hypothetical protein